MKNDLSRLCNRIGYQFKKINFLKQALTHRSAGNSNNERFEFLGDSILSLVIAHELFQRFPNESEGSLSRLRASLVKGDTLAEVAKEIGLGDFLYLGQGELKSGGYRRASILSDALEAIFAAIFFDSDMDNVKKVILNLFHSRLELVNLKNSIRDPKTELQELLQAHKINLPQYELVSIEGDEHEQIFHIKCSVMHAALMVCTSNGTSRRKAEQAAAKLMIHALKKQLSGNDKI